MRVVRNSKQHRRLIVVVCRPKRVVCSDPGLHPCAVNAATKRESLGSCVPLEFASSHSCPVRPLAVLYLTWFEFADLPCGSRPEFVSVITGDGRQILVRRLQLVSDNVEGSCTPPWDVLGSCCRGDNSNCRVPNAVFTEEKDSEAFTAVNAFRYL